MEARSLGIETIYQDLALCENLDATVNIFLGREPMHAHVGPASNRSTASICWRSRRRSSTA